MDHFLNLLRGQAAQADQAWAHPRVAIVTSVDPSLSSARATIQPEGILSGWLPIATSWAGNGWGFVCPPQVGDQVIVVAQEGDSEQGLIVGRLWSANANPPNAAPGECWLVHKTGTYIKLLNDGSLASNGPWTHHGDFHATGDVFDRHGSLALLRAHYNEHVHPPSETPPQPTD